MMRYLIEKKKYNAKMIDHLDIVFQNGNYVTIRKKECMEIRISLYDRLVRYEDGASYVGHSGYIKLKIFPRKRAADLKNNKAYIESRCTAENDVDHIVLYDENNWGDTVFGDIRCHMEDDFLILQFEPNQKYGPASSNMAYIDLPEVSQKDILKIDLDFENCETVMVYEDEILHLDLLFDEHLEWDGRNFYRSVKSGVLKLKLAKCYLDRQTNFLDAGGKRPTSRKITQRICGKGEDIHDICHLYITYNCVSCNRESTEKIETANMRFYEEEAVIYDEEQDGCIYDSAEDMYIGGYAKLERDGAVTVEFGERCVDGVKRIIEKKQYPVKIKEYAPKQHLYRLT